MKKREKPETVTPQKRTKASKHATSVPIPDRHMICCGSGIVHPQIFLRIMQGESYKFTRCPMPECKCVTYFGADRWDEANFDFGVTREQIMKMNATALIL